jgi:hypothetical protein
MEARSPEFRAWLQHQHQRGREEVEKITIERRLLLTETHGLERFTRRMALVELTGVAASWARGVHDGLCEAGHPEDAAVFALSPPFPESDPTRGDCDRLGGYVEAGMTVLQNLLSADGA